MDYQGKTYWIVGASEGLGRALAIALSERGAHLVLSARTQTRLEKLQSELSSASDVVSLDVRDAKAVAKVQNKMPELDGVIYAAGVYTPMKTKDWDQDQVEAMIDINFAGAARVVGPIAAKFAHRNKGHIVMIGSLSGFRGLSGAIGYGASKAGMMHLAENMNADLQNTNVMVQLINPGFIKTRLTDKNNFNMPFIMSPKEAAKNVLSAMDTDRFQSNFPRSFSWVFRGTNFLPAFLYYKVFGAKRG